MTTLEWIQKSFEPIGDGQVVIDETEESAVGVNPIWMSQQLGTVVPPTLVSIKELPLYQLDGWGRIIDTWKTRGIIV